jgi:hypothetical protein
MVDREGRAVQVFLSYRRIDVGGYAGRLTDALRERLGDKSVFQDVTAITLGEDFTVAIDRALHDCDAVLAVIGPGWLSASTPEGGSRLLEPDDYVRLELARALERNVLVIPVLVGGARMPAADALPNELQGLVERQGMALRDESWHQDLESLVRSLRGEPVLPTRRGRSWLVGSAAAVALAASSGLAWWTWASDRGDAAGSPATQLRLIPRSEDGYEACPAPNGDGWRSIELGEHLTGRVKVRDGSLAFTVKHGRWRVLESGKWQVSLDTEMENDTRQDLEHGSWNYNYLVLGQRQFELDAGGCFSADPAFVKPGLKGDARAGFVVACGPVGAIVLVMQDGQEQMGDDANITATRATESGDC